MADGRVRTNLISSQRSLVLTDIVGILPLEAHLQVVIAIDQVQEPVKQLFALIFCHAIDVLYMPSNREYALPSRDRIRAHDWMNSLQLLANIFRRAAWFIVQLEAIPFRSLAESWLLKGDRQSFQEFLVRFADAIVYLVA